MGYDVYYVALEALKAAGSTDPAKVMEALPGVTYDGVSGHIVFDETGDAIRDTAYIKTIDTAANGAWKFVTQQNGFLQLLPRSEIQKSGGELRLPLCGF